MIIQGGMGVGVSSWQLASTVAQLGHLGVVSGTAVAVTEARRLADGDVGGHVRRALSRFPIPAVADRVLARHLDAEGRGGERYRAVPRPKIDPGDPLIELTVAAAFVQVTLAKEGHDGLVGINLLEKIQLPTLPTLYGAMLAGVDYVLMGAGVPVKIPAVLDRLAAHEEAALPLDVTGASPERRHESRFDPRRLWDGADLLPVARPQFLAIVSSVTLAKYLAASNTGAPDGFVVELPVAGGHNAPPRGRLQLDDSGAPVYGPRDAIDLASIAALGLPFWLAGGYASPERVVEAQEAGAVGVQVGTAFAFCDESGYDEVLRRAALADVRNGTTVRTDPFASPTGYPFKVLEMGGTLSDPAVSGERERLCDLGYLRELYERPDGRIGYRCPAEPVADYVAKGGAVEDTVGRQCLCNALVADIGLGQVRRDGYEEPPLVTAGDDLALVAHLLERGGTGYTAADVIDHLLPAPRP
nr:nitronate monooxygenase [Egicoccus sp.]